MTTIDILRATMPKRCTYDQQVYDFAKQRLPDGTAAQIDVLAQSIQWALDDAIDTMKFEEESEHG